MKSNGTGFILVETLFSITLISTALLLFMQTLSPAFNIFDQTCRQQKIINHIQAAFAYTHNHKLKDDCIFHYDTHSGNFAKNNALKNTEYIITFNCKKSPLPKNYIENFDHINTINKHQPTPPQLSLYTVTTSLINHPSNITFTIIQ